MWGILTVGGIAFRETTAVEETGEGGFTIRGQESYPPQTLAAVRATHENVLGLQGQTVPAVLTDKTTRTAFYEVTGATSTLVDKQNGQYVTATWQLTLRRAGSERDVEFESRVPTIGRADELAGTQTPSFWHAPPVGVTSYYTGATVPAGSVVRDSAEGAVTVFTGLPVDVAPRWTAPASSYLAGSARVAVGGIRRAGLETAAGADWELSNGLVRVAADGFGFAASAWDSGAYRSVKGFVPAVSGVNLATVPEFTILRNTPEEVAARLTYPTLPGRVTVDLCLRRGARFVTGVMKRHSAATLGIRRTAAEAVTAPTGGLRATSADADGNRFVVLSSRLPGTTDLATAYFSKATVTQLDFAVGFEVGAAPVAGDAFADLLLQYLGTQVPTTRVIRR